MGSRLKRGDSRVSCAARNGRGRDSAFVMRSVYVCVCRACRKVLIMKGNCTCDEACRADSEFVWS
eukprot:1289835-Pleurochrysis_carterae.AAC.1